MAHYDGVNRSRLGRREGIGGATVERWFQDFLRRELAERRGAPCPRVLGIDEHFFSRKDGYATTFCDLAKHTIFDVVLGRSEAALEDYPAEVARQRARPGRLYGPVERRIVPSCASTFPRPRSWPIASTSFA